MEPVTFEFEAPAKVANWRPIVQWFLAIPHWVISQVLGYVSGVLAIISFFAVLFTQHVPAGIHNFQVMVIRYRARVTMYSGFTHEQYPKFEFPTAPDDPGGDPVRLSVQPAGQLSRGNAFNWLLAIPHYILLIVFSIGAFVVWVINFFIVLFTGKWNEGHREFLVKVQRYQAKVWAYALMLDGKYPAFGLS